jgi:EAL domain-containing protein (putative c-di-GMP-specific phosphodiesterase class I)
VRIASGHMSGCEALVRWLHPEHGLIAPGTFLPVAEETGLIIPLGQWIFNETCRQIRAWRTRISFPSSFYVSVNVSHKQFWHPGLREQIRDALQAHGLEGRNLQIEITEGVVMGNPDAAKQILQHLHNQGLALAIDDFGIGYSSLDALHQFPIDALKIDRSFVAQLDSNARSLAILRTMILMGRSLGLDIVAEGIETEAQQRQLQQLQCMFGQGYLFAKPLLDRDMQNLLAQAGRFVAENADFFVRIGGLGL